MQTPASPGWYEDPEDAETLRYFDGVVWTAHTTPLRSPTAAASTIGRAAAMESETERRERAAQGPSTGGQQRPWSAPPVPTGTSQVSLPDGAVLAEWWRRLLGRGVDWVVTSIVSGLLSLPFLGPLVDAVEASFSEAVAGRTPDEGALQAAIDEAVLPVTVITLVVGLVYEVGFLVWRSATPGKMLLGTVVRPVARGDGVPFGVALRRQTITVVTSVLGLNAALGLFAMLLSVLDPAWLLWDPRRQALHDKVADTVVVLRGRTAPEAR